MLTPEQKSAYFDRSFKAVDGLWFMKVEERFGFEAALDLDVAVWEILPKIQARQLKESFALNAGRDSYVPCFSTKLELDGYRFHLETVGEGRWDWVIEDCPWLFLLKKSKREHLAGKIGARICKSEFRVFAKEFLNNPTIEFGCRLCEGEKNCRFSITDNE